VSRRRGPCCASRVDRPPGSPARRLGVPYRQQPHPGADGNVVDGSGCRAVPAANVPRPSQSVVAGAPGFAPGRTSAPGSTCRADLRVGRRDAGTDDGDVCPAAVGSAARCAGGSEQLMAPCPCRTTLPRSRIPRVGGQRANLAVIHDAARNVTTRRRRGPLPIARPHRSYQRHPQRDPWWPRRCCDHISARRPRAGHPFSDGTCDVRAGAPRLLVEAWPWSPNEHGTRGRTRPRLITTLHPACLTACAAPQRGPHHAAPPGGRGFVFKVPRPRSGRGRVHPQPAAAIVPGQLGEGRGHFGTASDRR